MLQIGTPDSAITDKINPIRWPWTTTGNRRSAVSLW